MLTLDQLIKYYTAVGGPKQYTNYIRSIDRINKGQTVQWIIDVVKKKGQILDAVAKFDTFFIANRGGLSSKTISNYKSGFTKFTEVTLGFFSANAWLTRGKGKKTNLFLCQLIADNALFASKEIVEQVRQGKLGTRGNKPNNYASWDYMAHARILRDQAGNPIKRGVSCPDNVVYPRICGNYQDLDQNVSADDNTYANQYIKKAVLASFKKCYGGLGTSLYDCFTDYEACHIWDLPGDRRYYASIANLVLLPKALAGLTDHNDMVKELLRYEAFKRFQFKPDDETTPPPMPKYYDQIKWRYTP